MGQNVATDLTNDLWNAIADLVSRSVAPREVYFVKVKKSDTKQLVIWTEEFGDIGIPLVALPTSFVYYDTLANGTVAKREDRTGTNPLFQTKVVCPKPGETVVVLDPTGAKRFPICIGVIHSKSGFWEET